MLFFLKYPEEEEQIIILQSALNKPVLVGDRVQIEEIDGMYHIEILREETEQKKRRYPEFNGPFTS
ncbi:hypothetical protein OL548_33210 [Lysinibacillus sp. MHQ-1]|nr:hypothetical protein OL548_33210 [Lysinibacillus sp. MHQ-1]